MSWAKNNGVGVDRVEHPEANGKDRLPGSRIARTNLGHDKGDEVMRQTREDSYCSLSLVTFPPFPVSSVLFFLGGCFWFFFFCWLLSLGWWGLLFRCRVRGALY